MQNNNFKTKGQKELNSEMKIVKLLEIIPNKRNNTILIAINSIISKILNNKIINLQNNKI